MTKQKAEVTNSNELTLQALAACIQARIPAMLVGEPGVGKTASIRELAKSMDYELVTLLGSQMDPTDVTGLPKGEIIENDESGQPVWGTVYLAPWWQVKIMRRKRVILFLDEFSNTSSAVRASMLTMLQNREFPNGTVMPAETIVIGAMNPTESAADGWDLDAPTTNRIVFLPWRSTLSSWFDGMLDGWGKDMTAEELYWRRLIVRFLREEPSNVHKMNSASGTPEAHGVSTSDSAELEVLRYAWSSRRSWDNLATILSVVDRKAIQLQDELAAGTVGRSSTLRFRDWQMKNSVISAAEVLADPRMVDWSTVEVSDANIILKEVLEIIDKTNWENGIVLLDTIAEEKAHALVGAYLMEIFKKIVAGAREEQRGEEAKTRLTVVIRKYKRDQV